MIEYNLDNGIEENYRADEGIEERLHSDETNKPELIGGLKKLLAITTVGLAGLAAAAATPGCNNPHQLQHEQYIAYTLGYIQRTSPDRLKGVQEACNMLREMSPKEYQNNLDCYDQNEKAILADIAERGGVEKIVPWDPKLKNPETKVWIVISIKEANRILNGIGPTI